jgi:hypothetical protein
MPLVEYQYIVEVEVVMVTKGDRVKQNKTEEEGEEEYIKLQLH